MMIVCDIPIGKDDTGGPLYGFCMGNGYTGEELPKIRSKKVQKLEENVEFKLNGSFLSLIHI